MDIESVRKYCLAKAGTSEGTPFGPDTLVFKVMTKVFAIMSLDEDRTINLKCDPERALELRADYDFIIPGYHMNKKHWNTVQDVNRAEETLLTELIDHSYALVVKGLKKAEKEELKTIQCENE